MKLQIENFLFERNKNKNPTHKAIFIKTCETAIFLRGHVLCDANPSCDCTQKIRTSY